MQKLLLAAAILIAFDAAHAVEVRLLSHNAQTTGDPEDPPWTYITDGSGAFGGPPTDAIWEWDGTVLSSIGTYSAAIYLGNTPFGPSLLRDLVIDLSIDTSIAAATASSYRCDNGNFLGFVQFCGGYTYGDNFENESSVTYGPGLEYDIMLGGDDESYSGPFSRIDGVRNISTYDFGTVTLLSGSSTTSDFARFSIGNGVPPGTPGQDSETMIFEVLSTAPDVAIAISGGNLQECAEKNGSTVQLVGQITLKRPDDAIASVEWLMDGNTVGFGQDLTVFVPLGTHTIDLQVSTMLGKSGSDAALIDVVDTMAPTISISFADGANSQITSIPRNRASRVQINFEATDLCDPDPVVSATAGANIDDGEQVTVLPRLGQIAIGTEELMVQVTATDASDNMAKEERSLALKD